VDHYKPVKIDTVESFLYSFIRCVNCGAERREIKTVVEKLKIAIGKATLGLAISLPVGMVVEKYMIPGPTSIQNLGSWAVFGAITALAYHFMGWIPTALGVCGIAIGVGMYLLNTKYELSTVPLIAYTTMFWFIGLIFGTVVVVTVMCANKILDPEKMP